MSITKYGNYWSQLPQHAGNVYWVAPGLTYMVDGKYCEASDANDGLSPHKALRRVNRAWSLVTANQGDVIALLPGTHSSANTAGTATSVAANVAGVTMVGIGGGSPMRKRAALTMVGADQTVNVTAADIEFSNITFLGDALNTGSALVDVSSAGHRLHIHDCTFDVTAQTANTGILGIDALGAASYVMIERCVFHVDDAFGAMVDMTALVDSVVQDCIFSLQTGTLAAAITTGAAAARCYIRRNLFNCGAGTMTAPISGTGATIANGVVCHDNIFGVNSTVSVDNFDAAECLLSENYIATVGGGTGGTLIVAIT